MVKGTITVPFTIVIPKCGATPLPCADITKLQFAVVQHGLGVQRGWMMSEANELALRGIASVLIDLPYHGQRTTGAVDAVFEFTGATGSDGFADITSKSGTNSEFGFFSVDGNSAAGIPPLLPRAVRAAFFQSVVDIMQAFRLMGSGDLSALGTREPRLATLGIDDTREAYVGESFGSMIGTIVSAFEPKLVGSVLDVDGGGTIFPLLINSPTFAPIFTVLLQGALGTNLSATDPKDTDFSYNFAEWLLDVGDSLAYAPYVVAKQTWPGSTETDSALHVLQASAFQDELVPNPANLTLAQAMGLQPLTLSDGVAPVLTGWTITPATGQLTANAGGQTAAFIQFAQASHGMMSERDGEHTVSFTDAASMMWPPLNPVVMFTNPTDRLNQIMGDFTQQALAGTAPVVK
jgi:pimeloyl-ACP methyl ester carboxylesterase